jgi:hypothetical protein
MRTRMHDFAAILVLLVGSQAGASPVNLRVTDQTGAAFPDVLVIVKSLAGKGEIFRALTDQAGRAPERDLTAGLYRAIATCPYGICETRVTEFLVGDAPLELELKVDVSPTRGNVAIVGPSNQLKLDVLDAQGKPAIAAVLVRDSNAEFEQWYKTNSEGEVDCRATGNHDNIRRFVQGNSYGRDDQCGLDTKAAIRKQETSHSFEVDRLPDDEREGGKLVLVVTFKFPSCQ